MAAIAAAPRALIRSDSPQPAASRPPMTGNDRGTCHAPASTRLISFFCATDWNAEPDKCRGSRVASAVSTNVGKVAGDRRRTALPKATAPCCLRGRRSRSLVEFQSIRNDLGSELQPTGRVATTSCEEQREGAVWARLMSATCRAVCNGRALARLEQRRSRTRASSLVMTTVAVAAIVASTLIKPSSILLFNPSASAPRGWYLLVPAHAIAPDDYVVTDLPPEVRSLAAARGYLPSTVPLLKRVGATAGTHVCARGDLLFVNHIAAVSIRSHDGRGRPMQKWEGCRVLRVGEILVLTPGAAASFDSRYFGPLAIELVRGKAVPLWIGNTP
jgi:conjugative transfer signal peptidase TraF